MKLSVESVGLESLRHDFCNKTDYSVRLQIWQDGMKGIPSIPFVYTALDLTRAQMQGFFVLQQRLATENLTFVEVEVD